MVVRSCFRRPPTHMHSSAVSFAPLVCLFYMDAHALDSSLSKQNNHHSYIYPPSWKKKSYVGGWINKKRKWKGCLCVFASQIHYTHVLSVSVFDYWDCAQSRGGRTLSLAGLHLVPNPSMSYLFKCLAPPICIPLHPRPWPPSPEGLNREEN